MSNLTKRENKIAKYKELLNAVDDLLTAVDNEGLYLGGGYDPKLPKSSQEGPRAKRVRKLRNALIKEAKLGT